MGDRRKSRELALQALFYFDISGADAVQGLEDFCDQNQEALVPTVKPFFMDLVKGVLGEKERIDGLMESWAKNWKVSRMPVVDRNIMRIALFELIHREDIPATVSINEAVDLGKKFGTRDSGAFINGVLDQIRLKENLG